MSERERKSAGFSLIGILVLIVAMAIVTSIALETITPVLEESRNLETNAAMSAIGHAVAGDYALGGTMSGADFGYVGDVGSMPSSLSALLTNLGGYATWNGPYIRDEFIEATNKSITDSWGTTFNYSGGATVTSSGSGSSMSYTIVKATTDFLNCGFSGVAEGANGIKPGSSAGNLISVVTYPNGVGGTTSDTASISSTGVFTFASGLPIGIRAVLIKDTITADSASSFVRLLPRSTPTTTNIGTLRLPTTSY
jgi:type II secretory pathway pseudopilin PulG